MTKYFVHSFDNEEKEDIMTVTSHVNINLVVLGRLAARSVLLSEKGLGRNHILHDISCNMFLLEKGLGAVIHLI